MKATIIRSTEYEANEPKWFIYVNENYYGDICYPRLRNFPTDMNYWREATCADMDRFFSVWDVEISEETEIRIKSLQSKMNEMSSKCKPTVNYDFWEIKDKKKRFEIRQKEEEDNKEICKYNEPFEHEYWNAYYEIRNILKNIVK